jgi:hypothetical protein
MRLKITMKDNGHFHRTLQMSLSKEQVLSFLEEYRSKLAATHADADLEELLDLVDNESLIDEMFCFYEDAVPVDQDLDLDSCYSKTEFKLIKD